MNHVESGPFVFEAGPERGASVDAADELLRRMADHLTVATPEAVEALAAGRLVFHLKPDLVAGQVDSIERSDDGESYTVTMADGYVRVVLGGATFWVERERRGTPHP